MAHVLIRPTVQVVTLDTPRIADAARGLRHMFVRDLVLDASIGVHRHEQAGCQRIRINIDLAVEDDGARARSREAIGADRLTRVVDYGTIAQAARDVVSSGHVMLVETLAERIAENCLRDMRVFSARIRIEKLDIFPDAVSAGVEIERRRP